MRPVGGLSVRARGSAALVARGFRSARSISRRGCRAGVGRGLGPGRSRNGGREGGDEAVEEPGVRAGHGEGEADAGPDLEEPQTDRREV